MALIGSLTSGVSALRSFSKGLEVIGNNIANVNTIGYKSTNVTYEDSFSNTLRASSSGQAGVQVGTGVQVSTISTNFTQGSLDTTGTTTDVGVSGNGFFIVKDSGGADYATRDGQFTVDSNGYLVTSTGNKVQGLTGGTSSNAPATLGSIQIGLSTNIPSGASLSSISIGSDGKVTENYSDGTSAVTNQILLQNFNDPQALMKEGGNLYSGLSAAGPVGGSTLLANASGANVPSTNGLGSLSSGTLESSNVDLTQQFSDLITAQRSFQAGSRLLTVSDTILDDVVNLKRS